MSCPTCGHENPAESNFCANCGTRLASNQAPQAPKPPEQQCPTHVGNGRYTIERFLGEGGRKRVYLAHDTMLDRDVAVGVVKTSGLTEDARTRVTREAQSMARLGDHPHVVTVHDIGEEDGDPYIVSQYMAGGSLDEQIKKQPEGCLDIATTLRVAEGVSKALEY